jgi:Flp pilus assembly protein TadG
MLAQPLPQNKRSASAVVETVAVVIVFLMLLFGVLEYCRYLFIRQLVANATREGARFAVVNTNSATLDADTKAKVTQMMGGMDQKVRNFTVQIYAGDANGNMAFEYDPNDPQNYAYQTDSSGNKYLMDNTTPTPNKFNIQSDSTGPYVVDPKTSGKVYLTLNTVTNGVTGSNAANQTLFSSFTTNNKIQQIKIASDTPFGTYIVVQVDLDYDPILPVFLMMPKTLHITSKSSMYSEAN